MRYKEMEEGSVLDIGGYGPHNPRVFERAGFMLPWSIIRLKMYSQIDPQWMMDQLGDSDHTIGQWGCAVCACAMVLSWAGIRNMTPPRLNRWLLDNDGYNRNENGHRSLMDWWSVEKLWDLSLNPSFSWRPVHFAAWSTTNDKGVHDWLWRYTEHKWSDPLTTMVNLIKSYIPVICNIDAVPETPKFDGHFVVAVGLKKGKLVVYDPLDYPCVQRLMDVERVYGTRVYLPSYG